MYIINIQLSDVIIIKSTKINQSASRKLRSKTNHLWLFDILENLQFLSDVFREILIRYTIRIHHS